MLLLRLAAAVAVTMLFCCCGWGCDCDCCCCRRPSYLEWVGGCMCKNIRVFQDTRRRRGANTHVRQISSIISI